MRPAARETDIGTTPKTITITVDDVNEPPDTPNAPSVSAVSETSLRVSLVGSRRTMIGPAIERLRLPVQEDERFESGDWTEGTNTPIAGSPVTIPNLDEGTEYEVQIRAKNDEGESQWSDSETGETEANAAPEFDNGPTEATWPEKTPMTQVLLTVTATDSDDRDLVTYSKKENYADESNFSLDPSTGELRFSIVPDHENPQDAASPYNVYEVVVQATGGTGGRKKTIEQTITITVYDVDEPPETPGCTIGEDGVCDELVRKLGGTDE